MKKMLFLSIVFLILANLLLFMFFLTLRITGNVSATATLEITDTLSVTLFIFTILICSFYIVIRRYRI